MADYETTSAPAGGTTIIEKKSSGGTILIAIVLLLAVLIGGFYLMSRAGSQNAKDNAVTGAAQSVSSAADKVGDAATGK
jgi:flagellar basal body-associated protein FliL